MTRRVTLTLGEFVAEALHQQARANALSSEEFVDRAVRYYLSERSTGRPARKVPGFVKRGSDGRATELQCELEKALWDELEPVAEREGTSIERLIQHAVLLLVADLDSGRVATRFVREPGAPPLDGGAWA